MTALSSNGHSPTAVPSLRWPSEIEQYVIGGVFISDQALSMALEDLAPGDFFDVRLGAIFEAMAEMHAAGDPVDRLTVREYLNRAERLEDAGGDAMLTVLNGAVPDLGNYRRYVRDVRLAALDRREVSLAYEIVNGASPERTRDENRRDLAAVIAMRRELETPEPWPLLPSPVLPEFPLEALPDVVSRFIEAVAEQTQTPPDLAAFAALGVLSAASLGAVVECGGWDEEIALYLMAVLGTGERKSAALNPVVEPLRRAQRENAKEAKPEIARLRAGIARLEARRTSLTKRYGSAEDPDQRAELEQELDQITVEIDEIGEPVEPRLLADDATPEALSRLLAQHGKIAILAAEAPLMDNLIGRYDASGSANLHLVCQAYSGESTSVDRRGRDPELIDRPLLTVALTVQPHVLRNLVEHRVARDQGLVARFCYALPKSKIGTRETTPAPVPLHIREAWTEIVQRVFSLNPRPETTEINSGLSGRSREVGVLRLSLSPPARNLLNALRAEQEPQLAAEGELHGVGDWIARHAGRVARVAGLIHLATGFAPDKPVSADTMARALTIGEYLLAHGRAAIEQPDASLRRALQWLEAHGERTVTQRDLYRGPLNKRGTVEETTQLARRLVNLGALRPLEPEQRSGPGRPPSPAFAVNPRIWSKRENVVELRPRAGAVDGDHAA